MSNVEWDSKLVIGNRASSSRPTAAGRSNSAINAARRTGAVVSVDRKTTGNKSHQGPDHQRIAKLDRENEVAPPPKINPAVGKAMQAARQAKELTQSKLASTISEPVKTVQDYESGKAIPNPQTLGKIERALGVKLRGAQIGAPLGGPKRAGPST